MGRPKKNKVYEYYDFNRETSQSKCLIDGCNYVMKGRHGSNLLRHFFSKHKNKYDEIIEQNKENVQSPTTTSTTLKKALDYCTDLVTNHGRPLTIVEDEAFKQILKLPALSQNEISTINVQNIKHNIEEMAYQVRYQIGKDLSKSLLALKLDVASIKLRRFLGLNVQYIMQGQIVLRNLSVLELHDKNTANYLKESVMTCLSRYGIHPKQILTITTDNGANMIRMVDNIEESIMIDESTNDEVEQEQELEIDLENVTGRKVTGIRCAAHCLQLAVKDACLELESFLDDCRLIIRALRTPNMALKLKQQCLPQAVLDTPVRWDSTADMLDRLLILKSFCIEHYEINATTWSNLDKYIEILGPCRILSKSLQKEQLTFGDFYISWMKCQHQVSQIDDPFANYLEICLINRLTRLFENDHFLAAIYLDPRVNSILTTQQCTIARALLTNIYKRIIELNEGASDQLQASTSSAALASSSSSASQFDDYLRQQFALNRDISDTLNINSVEQEINFKLVEFLTHPILPYDDNILTYWEKKRLTDPYLYNLAKVVLATPPTTVSVERLFSSLKFVLSNLRMRLNDCLIEDIMVVRNNNLYSNK